MKLLETSHLADVKKILGFDLEEAIVKFVTNSPLFMMGEVNEYYHAIALHVNKHSFLQKSCSCVIFK